MCCEVNSKYTIILEIHIFASLLEKLRIFLHVICFIMIVRPLHVPSLHIQGLLQEERVQRAEAIDQITVGAQQIPIKNRKLAVLFVQLSELMLDVDQNGAIASLNTATVSADVGSGALAEDTGADRFVALFQCFDDAWSMVKNDMREMVCSVFV